jgi:DNA polymerase-3 subunit delta'
MSWGIVGHDGALCLLQSALDADNLAHSLLFTGPRQVGKRSLGLALARTINCSGPEAPCGACRACRLAESGGYQDLHLLELRQGRQRIGIAEVQQLQADLARRPAEGRRRIALISDAERLSDEAENCLLKTIEEPPPHALLILTVEEAEALLPTTVSRCRQIRLKPVPTAAIHEYLATALGVDAERAAMLAALADGRPGRAISAAGEEGYLPSYRASLERLERALATGRLGRLEIARSMAESWSRESEAVREELRLWMGWWRDLLLARLGLAQHVGQLDHQDELRRRADRYSTAELRAAIATLVQARDDLDQNVNPRLALDLALLRLPNPGSP